MTGTLIEVPVICLGSDTVNVLDEFAGNSFENERPFFVKTQGDVYKPFCVSFLCNKTTLICYILFLRK